MVFSHAFAGAALTKLIFNKNKGQYSKNKTNLIYFVGIFAAILPDLDIALLLIDKSIQHRMLISHSLAPYFLIYMLLILWSLLNDGEYIRLLAKVFFVGALSHLALDMIAGGVALWAPISTRLIGIPLNFPTAPISWVRAYVTSKYMIAEFALFLGYLWAISKDNNRILKGLPIFLFIIAIATLLVVNFILL